MSSSSSRLASKAARQRRIDDGDDPRSAKLQRVMNIKGTSASALKDILSALGEDAPSTKTLSDVQQSRFATMTHAFKLPKIGGGNCVWELCHPTQLLFRIVAESPTLQSMFEQALLHNPSSAARPWNVLVGWDEFTPGNKLAVQNSRMTMVLSFSFAELGSALSMDMAWFTPIAVRTSLISQVDGGWSVMLREFLELLLFSPNGLQSPAGVALQLGQGRVVTLHGRIQRLLSDGDGLRKAMQWMGHASTKPCWRHWNVLRKGSGLAEHDPSRRSVEITCAEPDKFITWDEGDFRQAMDMLVEAHRRHADAALTSAELEDLQKAIGFRTTPTGLLADGPLRAAFEATKAFRFDWVHTLLANGTVTLELWQLVAACEKCKVSTQSDIADFLRAGWTVPKHRRGRGGDLSHLFGNHMAAHNRDADTLKASASELLHLYGLLRYWAESVLPSDHGGIKELLAAFLAACKVMDIAILAKRGALPNRDAAARLMDALVAQLTLHKRCHGDSKIRPKHHWCFDVAQQMAEDDAIFDAFVIERLHLRVKKIAENVRNTSTFERSTLSGVVNEHARTSQQPLTGCGLVGRVWPFPGVEGAQIADGLEFGGFYSSVGDLVFLEEECGKVVACCLDAGELYVAVEPLRHVRAASSHADFWARCEAQRRLWRIADLSEVLAWKQCGVETLVVRM